MPPRQYHAVFFDAAGTLFTVKGSVGEVYARLAREYGKEVAIADLEAGFRRCFATAPPMAFPGAAPEDIARLERRWWYELVQNVFALLGPFPRFAAYFDALFSYFAQAESWQLYPEVLDTLVALQHRGLRLGIISNFDSRLFGLLEGVGLAQFFEPVMISTQVGAAKPARAIFTQALTHVAHFGLAPHEVIHVGDSYEADIIGAQGAGLTPILIDRVGPSRQAASYVRIQNLVELLDLVDGKGDSMCALPPDGRARSRKEKK
jgi:putative hydrolase of the HAD superfamily